MFSINSFKSHINTYGVARNNRYVVNFSLPREVVSWLNSNNTQLGSESLSLRAESVQLPGYSYLPFETPGRIGYGPSEVTPYAPLFDDITITFIPDAALHIHKILWAWHNYIINTRNMGQTRYNSTDGSIASTKKTAAYELTYKNQYARDIEIHVYDETGAVPGTDNGRRMTVRLYKAWPRVLPQVDLSWASEGEFIRLAVPFNYADFDITYAAPRVEKTSPGLNLFNPRNTGSSKMLPPQTGDTYPDGMFPAEVDR